MAFRDDWPKISNGCDFDGRQLLDLVRSGNSPFHGVWDVNLLIREIEENLSAEVIDIPFVYMGSNNYVGHYFKIQLQAAECRKGFPREASQWTKRRGAFSSW